MEGDYKEMCRNAWVVQMSPFGAVTLDYGDPQWPGTISCTLLYSINLIYSLWLSYKRNYPRHPAY